MSVKAYNPKGLVLLIALIVLGMSVVILFASYASEKSSNRRLAEINQTQANLIETLSKEISTNSSAMTVPTINTIAQARDPVSTTSSTTTTSTSTTSSSTTSTTVVPVVLPEMDSVEPVGLDIDVVAQKVTVVGKKGELSFEFSFDSTVHATIDSTKVEQYSVVEPTESRPWQVYLAQTKIRPVVTFTPKSISTCNWSNSDTDATCVGFVDADGKFTSNGLTALTQLAGSTCINAGIGESTVNVRRSTVEHWEYRTALEKSIERKFIIAEVPGLSVTNSQLALTGVEWAESDGYALEVISAECSRLKLGG